MLGFKPFAFLSSLCRDSFLTSDSIQMLTCLSIEDKPSVSIYNLGWPQDLTVGWLNWLMVGRC